MTVFECEDCGWVWPFTSRPTVNDECDECGGELEPVETEPAPPKR